LSIRASTVLRLSSSLKWVCWIVLIPY
jgi:hypothetical protein